MDIREETRKTVTLNEDDIRLAVAEYLNRLYPEARVLWGQVSCHLDSSMNWEASATWTTKGD